MIKQQYKLCDLLIDRYMTKTKLKEEANYSTVTLARMGKQKYL